MYTSIISLDDKAEPNLYFTEKDTGYLIYSGIDPMYFLAFLLDVKKKANGKLASYSHISKFYDAIKYGSRVSNKLLSVDFIPE